MRWVAVGAAVVLLVAGGAVAALSMADGDGSTQATPTEVVTEPITDTTESDHLFGDTTDETTYDGFPGAEQAEPSTDCSGLVDALIAVGSIDSYEGSDYLRARDFLDDYADRAPEEIRDSVQTLRELLDDFASAAETVGLALGEDPLPDQSDQLIAALDLSSGEQEAIGRSFETVTTWSGNDC